MKTESKVKRNRRKQQRGMTLIEIMIVIVIIGLLGTGATIAYMSYLEGANEDTASNESCVIRSAVILYMAQNQGKCPTMDDLKGRYMDKKMRTTDPWGNDWVIECESGDPDVYSTGKDGSSRFGCEKGGGEDE
ncbi:MAG: prepilin-type N-terminal cleavage/methylation domain-containing protein [Deltaproteobacteria bacterium]|nr:prepilin-type N-terminal cleavage/methylation domain-containing protein [Deltaproteobacteria bacterium]